MKRRDWCGGDPGRGEWGRGRVGRRGESGGFGGGGSPMRGGLWRAKAGELYSLLMRILNWAVTLSLFNPHPVWERAGAGSVVVASGTRRSEAVRQESGVSDEKRDFLDKFGGVYGYPKGSTPIDKLRAAEFARLNGRL